MLGRRKEVFDVTIFSCCSCVEEFSYLESIMDSHNTKCKIFVHDIGKSSVINHFRKHLLRKEKKRIHILTCDVPIKKYRFQISNRKAFIKPILILRFCFNRHKSILKLEKSEKEFEQNLEI